MTTTVHVNWQSQRSFVATTDEGGVAVIDGSHSGKSMSASELLLAALGGCVSTTVLDILEKKRQQVTGYEVLVEGETMTDWPKSYTGIHITYRVRGIDIDRAAVERAVVLAETKYCTVAGSLKPPISWTIEILSEPTPATA